MSRCWAPISPASAQPPRPPARTWSSVSSTSPGSTRSRSSPPPVRNTLQESFGAETFDYLVNNAGIGTYAPYATTTPEQFDELVQTNLKAPFFLTQALLPLINEGGRVLNVSTALTRGVVPGMSAYAATKGAIEVLTRYRPSSWPSVPFASTR
ncbi:SDR family NAD(P)-dependent oxidoreductase [Streptomyces tendae]|uniref:SDR family NAD(P)-dependent oxidoreductase n=1 Tax=Streptomyces tendae TaxID=1932 RepID=UPI0036A50C66